MRVVFVENRAQVQYAGRRFPADGRTRLIALTAEALQALEEVLVPGEPVSEYACTSTVSLLDREINLKASELAAEIESFMRARHVAVASEGPGFLTGQVYYLQFSIQAVVLRCHLIREAILKLRPEIVSIFDSQVDPWFEGDGYAQNPWMEATQTISRHLGVQVEVVPRSSLAEYEAIERNLLSKAASLRYVPAKIVRRLHTLRSRLFPGVSQGCEAKPELATLKGLRLLIADGLIYDWGPVVEALRAVASEKCLWLHSAQLDGREWTHHYVPTLRDARSWSTSSLNLEPLSVDNAEQHMLSELLDEWLKKRTHPPLLEFLGIDLFPSILPHVRALTCLSPAIERYSDQVACKAIEVASPHAVCFFSMPWLSAKRMAHQCRKKGIPVLCYQHGAAYGTHDVPSHIHTELQHADYFLTYGNGNKFSISHSFPVKCKLVPVGSSRLEKWAVSRGSKSNSTNPVLKILWIAEASHRNVLAGAWTVEDTKRYLLEKQCLSVLASSKMLNVTFRPYPHQVMWDGTCRWISVSGLPAKVDTRTPLKELILAADIVITDTSSGNVWNEVLVLDRPLILYCDPKVTLLFPHFARDLEGSCHWCKSENELVDAIRRLAADGPAFLTELRSIDASDFVRNYVLHMVDGKCVERVMSFLNDIYGKAQQQKTALAVAARA